MTSIDFASRCNQPFQVDLATGGSFKSVQIPDCASQFLDDRDECRKIEPELLHGCEMSSQSAMQFYRMRSVARPPSVRTAFTVDVTSK